MNAQKIDEICTIVKGTGPLIAASIHDGHRIREDLLKIMALSEEERFREEDPFTHIWTEVSDTQIIALQSRFEVDLNRPRDKSLYLKPEDAWGLKVWVSEPDIHMIQDSLEKYDSFYDAVYLLLKEIQDQYGHFVVYDIHSYNYCRGCPHFPPADSQDNPEINIGTGSMDKKRWQPVVNRFIEELRTFDYMGRHLDVRENVKFRGGNFPRWIHETFPESGCALAIEFKKFFMDELTGTPNLRQIEALKEALKSTVAGVLEELKKL